MPQQGSCESTVVTGREGPSLTEAIVLSPSVIPDLGGQKSDSFAPNIPDAKKKLLVDPEVCNRFVSA